MSSLCRAQIGDGGRDVRGCFDVARHERAVALRPLEPETRRAHLDGHAAAFAQFPADFVVDAIFVARVAHQRNAGDTLFAAFPRAAAFMSEGSALR